MTSSEVIGLAPASTDDRACLPHVRPVMQRFEASRVDGARDAVRDELADPAIRSRVEPGRSVAIGVGSRGIADYPQVVAALVEALREWGAEPFVVPAMGSHGGGTADGQLAVLTQNGITEDTVGAPIRASMEVVLLGRLADGTAVYMDALAHRADGIVVVNRIKPHTLFRGTVESGLSKLLVAGLGNAEGVRALHRSPSPLGEIIASGVELVTNEAPFLFGLALLENGYGELAHVEAIAAERLLAREPELLSRSRELLPSLFFDELDVLVLEHIGKDISGQGLDPNVTGRNARSIAVGQGPDIDKIVALGLSPKAHGNAAGMGQLDVVSADLFRQIDFAATYANVITATLPDLGALPLVAKTRVDAVAIAIQTARRRTARDVRLVVAKSTKELQTIWVSTALHAHVDRHPDLEFSGPQRPLANGDALAL